tara:strand:+ start:3069 stop:4130 length:1062 start_codon:yes stop_codon:yes gene_type:complete
LVEKKELNAVLKNLSLLSLKKNKKIGFCIGNTRKISESGYFYTPIRVTEKLVAGSVIVYSVKQAREIINYIDGKVDYIFVDSEKKISSKLYNKDIGNIEREVRDSTKISEVITFKGNDLTVDSIDIILEQLFSKHKRGIGGKKATIIGSGNIGSKLALRLVERGVDVVITRRNSRKLKAIVKALNLIKPQETLAKISGTVDNLEASKDADIIIGLTSGRAVINTKIVSSVNKTAIFMDAGKGCFTAAATKAAKQRDLIIYRPDIKIGFEGFISSLFKTREVLKNSYGRSLVLDIPIVSGLVGDEGEIVVDNFKSPRVIYGMANGLGGFIETPNKIQMKKINILTKEISLVEVK